MSLIERMEFLRKQKEKQRKQKQEERRQQDLKDKTTKSNS